jgi:hypothetical protein
MLAELVDAVVGVDTHGDTHECCPPLKVPMVAPVTVPMSAT